MDIILPVAGFGTRLRPQTWSKPKPLVSLAGKPMLAHVLDRLLPLNPKQLIFITGFLGDQLETWAKATYTLPLAFVEQPEMLGQTDAILRTRHLAQNDALILFPDMLFEADFSGLATTDADVVAFTKEVDDPSAYGIAVVEGGQVTKLIEKPTEPVSHLAVIGIYYVKRMADLYAAIEQQMERGIKLKNEYFLADAIQLMIDGGAKVITAPVSVWEDCGNSEALLSTNRYLLDHDAPKAIARDRAIILQPSAVAESAKLDRAIIGPYASIGPGVTVRDAIVRDAIVEENATIEQSVIEHSIVGRQARLRGHAAQVNLGDASDVKL
ncbi:MAG: sugar phosphate nucleotidyltransferase [Chloroflexota bacterium]|nr:sugar phosphate nucleotidyltransferase [Chloroflexota bacterium]